MNGTPRLRSAFPQTPQTARRPPQNGTPAKSSSLPDAPLASSNQDGSAPLIPFEILDAPSQRLYVVGIYTALLIWRLYDFYQLNYNDTESLWLFMKWIFMDGIFLFGLPALRIPWLEWSTTTMTVLFLAHAWFDGMLMFRIGMPFQSWMLAFSKVLYDREIAINEYKVKPGDVLHNASLILGKQVIHILPEGSAILNPDSESFCLDSTRNNVLLPIQINQTSPILIEILRVDLDTYQNETITLSSSAVRKLRNEASKSFKHVDASGPLTLKYPVKKPGLYMLQKVVDESKLEVRTRRRSDAFVVSCPKAQVKATNSHRCKGELSNIAMEVEGTPPLKIKYRKLVDKAEREASFQSIQPDDFISPLLKQSSLGVLTRPGEVDLAWARSQKITVPLNETLVSSGDWVYFVEEVQDAFGNVVNYFAQNEDGERIKPKMPHLQQSLKVHERPRVELRGCDPQRPLRVAKGQSAALPVLFSSTGKQATEGAHTIEYLYTAEEDLLPTGEHSAAAQLKKITLKKPGQKPPIQQSGLYTLKSVSTEFCEGEVLEPASCLLQNPPEPDLSISTEEIFDKCAGNPIGLRVSLDLTGTPPFEVKYTEQKRGQDHHIIRTETFDSLRGQLELTPSEAGHYTYQFISVGDKVYNSLSVKHKELVLEQDVKPSASAHFVDLHPKREACIDEPVTFEVKLQGEGPWILEYELVHSGRRSKQKIGGISEDTYKIETPALKNGGEYSLALASVTDRLGCKEFLGEEAKIYVRHERPKAYFGQIERRRSIRILEGKRVDLPLRLTGKRPWKLEYRNIDTDRLLKRVTVNHANDFLQINEPGTFELVSVHDLVCPGSVDDLANHFEVNLIPRPHLMITPSNQIRRDGDNKFLKQDICEGDEDTVEISLNGAAPYDIKYEERFNNGQKKSQYTRVKELSAALGTASIQLSTSQAGQYEYKFLELSDANYNHDKKRYVPITVAQTVNPRPSAWFAHPGKTFTYCAQDESAEEPIAINLEGEPPFELDLEIRHHTTAKPEIVTVHKIPSTKYTYKVQQRFLRLGVSNIAIRSVRDSRGCQRRIDDSAPRVQISVHEAPSISPLETRSDFCVGDRLSFSLSGVAPFTVYYTFNNVVRKAKSDINSFRRLAEKPGSFVVTGVQDSASDCKALVSLEKHIHSMPWVRVSKGRESVVDIHEGGVAEILFEFGGTPPFEFTYTRSTNADKGKRSVVLETKTEISQEYSMRILASEEGTYEVIAIRDKWCSFSKQGAEDRKGQKRLKY